MVLTLSALLLAFPNRTTAASISAHAGILSVSDVVGGPPTIRFALPASGDLQVSVWNSLGQRVSRFSATNLQAGVYAISWDGLSQSGQIVGAGIYFVRIVAHGRSYSHKIVHFRGDRGQQLISYVGPAVGTPEPNRPARQAVSGPLRRFQGQPLTAADWAVLASPASHTPEARHEAFGRALAQLQAGDLTPAELRRQVGGTVSRALGGARPQRRRAAAKPILLQLDRGLYQVHEAQYIERFRGINLLGDAEQDGDVDFDDLMRATDALGSGDTFYDLNRNGDVDLWDLFAVVDQIGLRREGPFLLLNESGLQLYEAAVTPTAAGDLPRIEYFNPGAADTPPAIENLVRGLGNVLPAELQRPGLEPFVVVEKALLNQMRLISPLAFWSGVVDAADAQTPSYRFVSELLRQDQMGRSLEGLQHVAFGYRMPRLDDSGDLIREAYEYSQVLVFGWHFSPSFNGLPKLDTFPVHPDLDLGYLPPGPAAISQLAVTPVDQAGRFRVVVNANRVSFGVRFFVSTTNLDLEDLFDKGKAVPVLAESGSGFAREFEIEIPAGEWLLYGGLLVDGGNLAGLAVAQVSSAGAGTAPVAVSFADRNLEAALRRTLAKPEGALLPTDLNTLEELVAPGQGIADLTGLEQLTALRKLDLRANEIADLGPLSALPLLSDLQLGDNRVVDLSPLTALIQLDAVGLENNLVQELSALVANSGLKRGDTIDLRSNPLAANALANDLCRLVRRRVSVLGYESCGVTGLAPDRGRPLFFRDVNLEAAVRVAIGKAEGAIFAEDVGELRDLEAVALGIVDLDGIGQLTSLRTLDLRSNGLRDVAALVEVTGLQVLLLGDNAVSDLSPLTNLVELEVTKVQRNRIRDLAPLVANDGIREGDLVDVCGNPLNSSDTDPQLDQLRARLVVVDTTLGFVDPALESSVRETIRRPDGAICVEDVEPVRSLNLNFTDAERLDGIEALVNLEELHAVGNHISDLAPLAAAVNLRALFLDRNRIVELAPLQSLPQLARLSLGRNQISTLTPLAPLRSLVSLTLNDNQLSEISTLSALTNLTSLAVDANAIEDLSPLTPLANLRRLTARDNRVADLSPLMPLTNLTGLALDGNQIVDLSPLAPLDSLLSLSLGNNLISNAAPLSGLVHLTSLSLARNQLSDVGTMAALIRLKTLLLDANLITDLAPLLANEGLGPADVLSVRENPLGDAALSNQIPALRSRGVDVVL